MSGSNASSSGPLAGLRILDLTTVVMGPYATQILADYGAEVIKVEPPEGDVMRLGGLMRSPKMGPLYMQANRNKRSIALDLQSADGHAALLRLAARADVLVSNIRPAAMQRLKLGYDDVRAVNAEIVYVSLFGYGETGPYAGRPAYDDLIQGLTGMPALYARQNETAPRYVPVVVADRIVGLNAVHAILAAIVHRERTGEGQAVEVPMFETMAGFVLGDHLGGRSFEPPLGEAGYSRIIAPDRRPYETGDGYICVLVYTDKQWEGFFRVLGDAALAADPRFKDQATRAGYYNEIYALLADVLRTKTTDEWLALLQEADIPCTPVYDLDDLIDDPHLEAVGFFHEMDHPSEGKIRLVGIPSRWSRTPPAITRHPPQIGEQSREILMEAGFAADEIERLIANGAVHVPRLKQAAE